MKKILVASGLVASLALSACGGSSNTDAFKNYLASLGGNPNVQMKLTADFTGAGSAKVSPILKELSFGVNVSDPNGGNLSDSGGKVNFEMTAAVKGATFVDLREINNALYFNLNVSAIASIPGINLPKAELNSIQLVFGGRWFELQSSVINSMLPAKTASKAKVAENTTAARNIIDAISAVINAEKYKDLGNGKYSVSGTLLAMAKAIDSALNDPSIKVPTAASAQGTYTIEVATSGSTATDISLAVTAPNGTKGNATATLNVAVTHSSYSVSVPAGATMLTKTVIAELLGSSLGGGSKG